MAGWKPRREYVHKPLTSPRSFRVLELLPSPIFISTVSCQIREVYLDDNVEYEALSYVWGEKKPGCSVSIGTKTLAVTPNCLDALRYLRRKFRRRVLWVDAICIDQRDSQPSMRERNHQVELMGKIYSEAHTVLVWLGLDLIGSCTIHFGVLKYLSREKLLRPFKPIPEWLHRALIKMWNYPRWLSSRGLTASYVISFNDWWYRAWTFQEQAFARRCVLLSGRRSISMRDLLLGCSAASNVEPEYADSMQLFNVSALAAHNRLNYETYKMHEADNSVQSPRRLAKQVLTAAMFMYATLPVDSIYALYAMLVMYGLPLPEPDYNKPFEVVYEETVWAWIQKWQDLSILHTAAREAHIRNLPSWVPAYHLPINSREERLAFKDYSWGYIRNEDNPYLGHAEARHIPKMLKVKGRYIGKITRGCHNLSCTCHNDKVGEILSRSDLCRHLPRRPPQESLGYDVMLRELFETLMFPRRSEYINDDNFLAFKSWYEFIYHRNHAGLRHWGLTGQLWIREFEAKVFPCSLYILENCMLGKGNPWYKIGDELFLLRGADCPFVLRRDGKNYRLVGPAYVRHLHRVQPWRFDGDDVRDITLV